MNQGRYVFTQLVDFLPRKHFEWLVSKYEGNKYVKSFSCWNHLLVLLFGQLSNREGLRDLIVTLSPVKFAFHHLGFGKSVTRSNLSKANETREVRIFQEFADRMVELARKKRDDYSESIRNYSERKTNFFRSNCFSNLSNLHKSDGSFCVGNFISHSFYMLQCAWLRSP